MKLVKICPACNRENEINEVMCLCMSDISSVTPTIPSNPDERIKLQLEGTSVLLSLLHGATIGRESKDTPELNDLRTLSREHAKVQNLSAQWYLVDLNSTNGTWINEIKLTSGSPRRIFPDDVLYLSKSCRFTVLP